MMVKDHRMANADLTTITKTKNITLPSIVDENHQKKLDELSKKTQADFDKAYVNARVDGHKSLLKLMEYESKDGKDAELKAFAAKTAPIVQSQLVIINKIHGGMK